MEVPYWCPELGLIPSSLHRLSQAGVSSFLCWFASLCCSIRPNFDAIVSELHRVGYSWIHCSDLGVVSLSPFVVMTLFSIPKIDPSRWISLGEKGAQKNWTLFSNTLFWKLNSWDSASNLAGEVEDPQRTFPKTLFAAALVTCLGHLVPILAATGAIPLRQEDWINGSFADFGEVIAGKWLKVWIEIGACLSVVGLYEAQLSSCVYQVLGMAELGFLPVFLGMRSRWFNTPWVGILVSTIIALAGSCLDFADIISSVNFLYCLVMLLEFASFLWLRRKLPNIKRPFRVPMELPDLVIMCLIPCGFPVYVMAVATTTVYLVSAILTFLSIVWYFLINLCRSKMWVQFNDVGGQLQYED